MQISCFLICALGIQSTRVKWHGPYFRKGRTTYCEYTTYDKNVNGSDQLYVRSIVVSERHVVCKRMGSSLTKDTFETMFGILSQP